MAEYIVVIIEGAFAIVVATLGIMWAYQRWKTEKLAVLSEVKSDEANSVKAYAEARGVILQNQERLFELLRQHNEEFLKLHGRIRDLEKIVGQYEGDLATERRRSSVLEAENTALRKEIADLKAQVEQLRCELMKLKKAGDC